MDQVEQKQNQEIVKGDDVVEKESKSKKDFKNEITKLKSDVEHWKNEYYRAYADTKNLRVSLEKDQSNAIKYRAAGFIDALIPILDSFRLAIATPPNNPDLKNYLTGFTYIYRNLIGVLENEGVKEIIPKVGEKFNSDTMNAVEVVESEEETDCVYKVYGNGYKLHDRMVRHAMVAVTGKKKPPEETKKDEKNQEQEKPIDNTEKKLDA